MDLLCFFISKFYIQVSNISGPLDVFVTLMAVTDKISSQKILMDGFGPLTRLNLIPQTEELSTNGLTPEGEFINLLMILNTKVYFILYLRKIQTGATSRPTFFHDIKAVTRLCHRL